MGATMANSTNDCPRHVRMALAKLTVLPDSCFMTRPLLWLGSAPKLPPITPLSIPHNHAFSMPVLLGRKRLTIYQPTTLPYTPRFNLEKHTGDHFSPFSITPLQAPPRAVRLFKL
jgi:hypothetical protein